MAGFSASDCALMARALELAARGRYTARPNPMVGCVLSSNGTIVGEGWHRRAGEAHAEVNALAAAGEKARGAIAHITLEPCSHHGLTPPCTDALIDAGVAEVVFATGDPSDDVNGEGARLLEAAGIRVRRGCLESRAVALNRGFLSRVSRKRPFARLKLAMSLDGAVAMQSGESQWITGRAARADVQRLRAGSGAVMTGIGTVLADDPSLTVRDSRFEIAAQPLRVVLDTQARMPDNARMLSLPGNTLIFAAVTAGPSGAETVAVGTNPDGGLDVRSVYRELAARGINDLLIECGPRLAGHLLTARLVDELVIYQSPHIMGSETRHAATTPGWTELADRLELDVVDRRQIGRDVRITAGIVGRTHSDARQ